MTEASLSRIDPELKKKLLEIQSRINKEIGIKLSLIQAQRILARTTDNIEVDIEKLSKRLFRIR